MSVPVPAKPSRMCTPSLVRPWPNSDLTSSSNVVIDGDTRWRRANASYIRDEVFRATHLAISGAAARGRFVHLFLNGVYWGVINVIEHLDTKFASEHMGGARRHCSERKDQG